MLRCSQRTLAGKWANDNGAAFLLTFLLTVASSILLKSLVRTHQGMEARVGIGLSPLSRRIVQTHAAHGLGPSERGPFSAAATRSMQGTMHREEHRQHQLWPLVRKDSPPIAQALQPWESSPPRTTAVNPPEQTFAVIPASFPSCSSFVAESLTPLFDCRVPPGGCICVIREIRGPAFVPFVLSPLTPGSKIPRNVGTSTRIIRVPPLRRRIRVILGIRGPAFVSFANSRF